MAISTYLLRLAQAAMVATAATAAMAAKAATAPKGINCFLESCRLVTAAQAAMAAQADRAATAATAVWHPTFILTFPIIFPDTFLACLYLLLAG